MNRLLLALSFYLLVVGVVFKVKSKHASMYDDDKHGCEGEGRISKFELRSARGQPKAGR